MGSPLWAGNRQSYNMGLPTVEKCCACLELKTGTLIIGTLSLIGSCILGIIAIVGLIGSSLVASGVLPFGDKDQQGLRDASTAAGTVGIVVTSIMLIHGARTGNPCLLMPWLVLTSIYIIWDVVQVIIAFVNLEWGTAVTYIVVTCIISYFFIAVYSFRKQLQQGAPVPKV